MAETKKAPEPTNARRVVVVDDNPDLADALGMLLQLEGHTVTTAYDGWTALKLIEETHPHVVFVDIGMPNMNGYELARTLSRWPGREATRLIAMTGWGQLDDDARSFAAGFDVHLTKPILPEQLSELLSGFDS